MRASSFSSLVALVNGNGEFNLPRQIAVDKNVQFLYVVDSENHRIQVFDNSGKYVKQWGGKGKSDAKFDSARIHHNGQ